MENLLLWIGRLGGIAGVVVCGVAFGARAVGLWNVAGFPIGTLLQAGMAAMILGCLGYCAAIAERVPK